VVTRLLLTAALALTAQAAEFQVRETAGLRRFGYPVTARIGISEPASSLCLTENGKPVPAQFTQVAPGRIEADFNLNIGPNERRTFSVAPGLAPPVASPIRVEERGDVYIIRHAQMEYHIPKDLAGLVSRVQSPSLAWIRAGGRGLVTGAGEIYNAASSRILKPGPLSAVLRFNGPLGEVDLQIPRSKSWVEVTWRDLGSQAPPRSLEAEIALLIEGRPPILDFGAGGPTYLALRPKQDCRLENQLTSWRLFSAGQSFAEGKMAAADSWAHVMDLSRATALAISGLTESSGFISLTPDALLRFGRAGAPATLRFWLHFVSMPIQEGALTSPQSMMSPLEVSSR
jgi:hypothetical protein